MLTLDGLFETHVTVRDLSRSMRFYGEILKLELAQVFWSRRVAFYWIGGPGTSMLGIWEAGDGPQRLSLHLAFRVSVEEILQAPARLQADGIMPLNFEKEPTEEPVVLTWMPAASLYFHDPDGNLLELVAMLPDAPNPDLGVVTWSDWSSCAHPRMVRREVENAKQEA